jgi:hypothetical protein
MRRMRREGVFATGRRRGGSAAAVLLAIGLLAGFSSVAGAWPQDPFITDFTTAPSSNWPAPTAGYPFYVEGTVDRTYPGWAEGKIYETTDGDRFLTTCWYMSCLTTAPEDPISAHPRDRTFRFELFSERNSYDSRELTVHQRKLWIGVRGNFTWSPGLISFEISTTLGGTDLATYVYDNGSVATSCNVYYWNCYTSVTAGHVYDAIIRDRAGNVFGRSPSYRATSGTTGFEETEEGLDLVRLALLYGTTSEICDELLTYPYGTHTRSSVNDQWYACETAVAARMTKEEVLRAVSLAGTGVLMWLMYDHLLPTLNPAFEEPDFEFPVTFPQPWPIDDIADRYMIQARGTIITQDDAIIATGACLWWAARASLSRSACDRTPIFFTGADVNKATTHDARQIFAHPEWVKLNYEYGRGKEAVQDRDWYKRLRPCTEDPPEVGDQCDEYPFWASEQGGPFARPLTPHLQWVNGIDNVRQGLRYGNFIVGCGLRSGTSYPDANATGGTAFLVIPLMPALHVPTFYVCNRD